jgi:methylaspartate mutase sigma subunit
MQPSESRTLITGVIGSDCHIVGTRILSMALEKAGFNVVSLGALTPPVEFVNAAVETDADAIMVSSLYGQGELDCRGFREICIEAGIGEILIYVGGKPGCRQTGLARRGKPVSGHGLRPGFPSRNAYE